MFLEFLVQKQTSSVYIYGQFFAILPQVNEYFLALHYEAISYKLSTKHKVPMLYKVL